MEFEDEVFGRTVTGAIGDILAIAHHVLLVSL
jgi:hypothetical protein